MCVRRFTFLLAALTCCVLSPFALSEKPSTPAKIPDATLRNAEGKQVQLHDLKGTKATVVAFLSFECPMSTGYSEVLAELAKKYGEQGVAFVGVTTNPEETAAQAAKQAQEFKLPFVIVKDEELKAADALKATVTPEVFVLDGEFVLRYSGRIDNRYAARLKKNREATEHDLRDAIDAVLAGKEVKQAKTEAFGCAIPRDKKKPAANSEVTYHRDVLPILQNQCQSCHRPGEVGPFSLMTYRQAVNWSGDIKDYTKTGKMPPWKPSEGVPFHNERKLTEKELATLAAWVDGGTPEGDAKDAPPPKKFTDGWQLGKPDLILKPSGDFHLDADGKDVFRCFPLPTDLPDDQYITAIEIRPGNPKIVHHALIFIDTSGQARKLEDKQQAKDKDAKPKDHGPGYSESMGVGFLPAGNMGGWAPGQVARHLPDDTGYLLPKKADVVVQVHYHRNGRPEDDRTSIGLYYAKKEVKHRFQGMVVPGRFFVIPAGEEKFKVEGEMVVKQDCVLHAITPHMHMLGRQIELTMTPPDGKPQKLIAIKDWDYNWQETYFLKEPIPIVAETKFKVEAIYDNTKKNPLNPFNPPRDVYLGNETTNEMCFAFLGATTDKPGRIKFKTLRPETKNDGD